MKHQAGRKQQKRDAYIGIVIIAFALFVLVNLPWPLIAGNSGNADLAITSIGEINSRIQYVDGDRIFESGNEVIWRAAGGSYLFHAGIHYKEAWQLHLQEIQAMGLNTARLAFAFSDSTPNPQDNVSSADILDFSKMDWILGFLYGHNIKAILDLHNCEDMYGDFGSEKLVNYWKAVAQHYRGDFRVVAYELFNEPNSLTWSPTIQSKMDAARFYSKLTNAIREVDPEHIVIWESQPYVPPLEEISDFLPSNIVFTFHRWWTDRKWEFEWTPEQLSYMSLSYAVEYRKKLGVPFWFGEFGSNYPLDSANPEWLLTEQHLWRCEEQVVGWGLWMGKTSLNARWIHYLPFFPLKVYNQNFVRELWTPPDPSFIGYVVNWMGADRLEPYLIEMWNKRDYVTLEPGIVVRVIVNHNLLNGTIEIISDQKLSLTTETTFMNMEDTLEHPGDWNTIIYPVQYVEQQ